MIIDLLLSVMLIVPGAFGTQATAKKPPAGLLGVNLGMEEEVVHQRLQRLATRQKEEREAEGEGEQEVWVFKDEPRFSYMLVRFNGQHRAAFITVMVRRGSRVPYAAVGDVKGARRQTDGKNYTYTWEVKGSAGATGYVVVARGSDPKYLTSYSVAQTIK